MATAADIQAVRALLEKYSTDSSLSSIKNKRIEIVVNIIRAECNDQSDREIFDLIHSLLLAEKRKIFLHEHHDTTIFLTDYEISDFLVSILNAASPPKDLSSEQIAGLNKAQPFFLMPTSELNEDFVELIKQYKLIEIIQKLITQRQKKYQQDSKSFLQQQTSYVNQWNDIFIENKLPHEISAKRNRLIILRKAAEVFEIYQYDTEGKPTQIVDKEVDECLKMLVSELALSADYTGSIKNKIYDYESKALKVIDEMLQSKGRISLKTNPVEGKKEIPVKPQEFLVLEKKWADDRTKDFINSILNTIELPAFESNFEPDDEQGISFDEDLEAIAEIEQAKQLANEARQLELASQLLPKLMVQLASTFDIEKSTVSAALNPIALTINASLAEQATVTLSVPATPKRNGAVDEQPSVDAYSTPLRPGFINSSSPPKGPKKQTTSPLRAYYNRQSPGSDGDNRSVGSVRSRRSNFFDFPSPGVTRSASASSMLSIGDASQNSFKDSDDSTTSLDILDPDVQSLSATLEGAYESLKKSTWAYWSGWNIKTDNRDITNISTELNKIIDPDKKNIPELTAAEKTRKCWVLLNSKIAEINKSRGYFSILFGSKSHVQQALEKTLSELELKHKELHQYSWLEEIVPKPPTLTSENLNSSRRSVAIAIPIPANTATHEDGISDLGCSYRSDTSGLSRSLFGGNDSHSESPPLGKHEALTIAHNENATDDGCSVKSSQSRSSKASVSGSLQKDTLDSFKKVYSALRVAQTNFFMVPKTDFVLGNTTKQKSDLMALINAKCRDEPLSRTAEAMAIVQKLPDKKIAETPPAYLVDNIREKAYAKSAFFARTRTNPNKEGARSSCIRTHLTPTMRSH